MWTQGDLAAGNFKAERRTCTVAGNLSNTRWFLQQEIGTGTSCVHYCSGHKRFLAAGNFKAWHLHCFRKSFQHKVFPLTGNEARKCHVCTCKKCSTHKKFAHGLNFTDDSNHIIMHMHIAGRVLAKLSTGGVALSRRKISYP